MHRRRRRRRRRLLFRPYRAFLIAITTWFLLPSRGEVLGIANEVIFKRRGKMAPAKSLTFFTADARRVRYSMCDMSCLDNHKQSPC